MKTTPFLRLLHPAVLASPLLFSALTASADFKDDIGYTALKAEYPDLPTGTNLGMFMGDFTSANTNWNWAVQPGAELTGKTITYLPPALSRPPTRPMPPA